MKGVTHSYFWLDVQLLFIIKTHLKPRKKTEMFLHVLLLSFLLGLTCGDHLQSKRNLIYHQDYSENQIPNSADESQNQVVQLAVSEFSDNEFPDSTYSQPRDEECKPPPDVKPPKNDIASSTLWDLLKNTEKELKVHNGDAVLLLGNTGSGKTTVALIITGDLKNLTVYETEGGSLIIVDEGQSIGITTSSRTLVPELIHDPPNSLHFYDCPGFLDNRDYKADITANYLMKKAFEGLTSVKPVFIVPEDSVTVGGIKTDFGYLANSAIRMITDLNKLQAGIGMVVSKVKNRNGRDKFRNDTVVLNGITKFLRQYREDEEKKLTQIRSKMNDESNTFVRRPNVYSPWRFKNSIGRQTAMDEQEAIRKRIQFVDILLQENKISILRSPDECGSFDQSTWSQESRDKMTKLIRDDLKSIPVEDSDFGYAVSADTTLKVVDLYKDLNTNVTDLMTELVNNCKTIQLELTLAIKDFFQVKAWLEADHSNFTKTIQDIKNSKSPKEFGRKMNEVLVARGYEQKWGLAFIAEMEKIESYMDFFDLTAPEGITYDRKNSEWLQPLNSWVTKEVSSRKEWYGFLDVLRKVYSEFRFQKDKKASAPTNIREIQASLGNDNHIVTDKIIELYDQSFGGGSEVILTLQDTDILWEVVKEAYETPQIECRDSKMTVKGSFVQVSVFTQSDGLFISCGGTNSPPSQVVVYATRKVFFDRSVNAQKSPDSNKELGIVSPQWDVIEPVILDLSGQNGSSGGSRSSRQVRSLTSIQDQLRTSYFDYPANTSTEENLHDYTLDIDTLDLFPSNSSKWIIPESGAPMLRNISLRVTKFDLPEYIRDACSKKWSPDDGGPGSVGSAGKHGGPGGNVIGLVGQIENADRLKVTVRGGAGGAGQNGGSGEEGDKGRLFSYDDWRECRNSAPCDSECPHSSIGVRECNRSETWRSWPTYFDTCHKKISKVIDCIAYGCVGSKGGRGGDGGAGGMGGFGGHAIIAASDGTKVNINSDEGSNGNNGSGGRGGYGGIRGNGALAGIHWETWNDCPCRWSDVKKNYPSSERSEDGANGVTGGNKNGQGSHIEPSFNLNQAALFLSYEEFALSRDSVYFPKQDFLDLIGNLPEVATNFTHIDFAQELLILERANLLLKNKNMTRDTITLMMLPKYQSYISRVDGHVKSRSLDDPQRKFHSLLCSTAFNQVRTLKQALGTPVVVDVSLYLETVDERLEGYSKTETKVIVEAERIRYKKTFTQKILDAMEFINETVDPAIEKTFLEMEEVTNELVVAIDKMIAEAEQAAAAYKDAVKQTKKKMQMQVLFDSLKIGGVVIGLVGGPAGAAVGGIIGGAAAIGEGIALGEGSQIRPPTPLDPTIKKYADQMEAKSKATSQERQDQLNTLIGESRMAATENDELLGDVTSKVDQLEKDKKELIEKGSSGSLKEFQDINKRVSESEKALFDLLKERNVFIKKAQNGTAGSKEEQEKAKVFGDKAIAGLKKVEAAVKIVSTLGLQVYKNHKNNKAELARLVAMVEEAEEQVKELNLFQEAVDGLLKPFTESVINDLDAAQKQMEGQNAVFLRVQQWQVKKVLRQYNFFLQDFSGAFPDVANQYVYLVEDLQEAMTLMIDLYSFMEQYNEQMQFADYIANINSPRGLAAKFGEEESRIFDQIELTLQGSIILSEWDTCIQTFEQWVYPFLNEFQAKVDTSDIPDYLSPTATAEIFTEILPDIRKRVTNLMIALDQYKSATFHIIDTQLHFTHFNSELISTFPFHVWKQEFNQDKIRDLFAGKKVTLPVTPEFTYKMGRSAVKFTIAEIEPKARDPAVQQKLKTVLDKLKVVMSHSGVSKYLYERTPFQMVGAKQEIHFNYQRDLQGDRVSPNQVYNKIKSGDMLLSPYTLWTVQLSKAHSNVEFEFADLDDFVGLVDLELIGKGSFVSKTGSSRKSVNLMQPIPLHYFRFKLSNLPPLGMNSRLQKLLLLN